jgi:hypothetical protein
MLLLFSPIIAYMTKDKEPMTKEQILAKWDSIGLYARNRGVSHFYFLVEFYTLLLLFLGTWMHYNIERVLNDLKPMEFEEKAQFEAFYNGM